MAGTVSLLRQQHDITIHRAPNRVDIDRWACTCGTHRADVLALEEHVLELLHAGEAIHIYPN